MNECIKDMMGYLEETADILGEDLSKKEIEELSMLFLGIMLAYSKERNKMSIIIDAIAEIIEGDNAPKILN